MSDVPLTMNFLNSGKQTVTEPPTMQSQERSTSVMKVSDGSSMSSSSESDDEGAANTKQPIKADTQAWRETVKTAVEITPYSGELSPKGYLHSAHGFLPACATAVKENQSQLDQDISSQIFNAMAPKLDELAKLRRFQLANFDSGAGLRLFEGRFGEIRKTFLNKCPVAVKRYVDHSDALGIFKEVHTLVHVQHKRVVELYGAFHEEGVTNVVMELNHGTVSQNQDVLSRKQKIRFALQLLEAVEHIHELNILHCDIRPQNCYISSQNNLVLAEFAYSQLLPQNAVFLKTQNETIFGSPAYNDPLANRGYYAKSTDVFSLGATIFELCKGEALMEYKSWMGAPVQEYIKVAEEGRLCEFPPSFKLDSSGLVIVWNLDGEREPLLDRVNTCMSFSELVWDLVKMDSLRLTARAAIEKYRAFFDQELSQVRLSREQLDQDPNLGDVQPCVYNVPALKSCAVSEKLRIAMDMIYFDANLNLATLKSEVVKEPVSAFQAIPLKQFQEAMNELILKCAVQMVISEEDGLGAPHSASGVKKNASTKKLTFDVMNETLKNITIHTVGLTNGSSKENSSDIVTEVVTFLKPGKKDAKGYTSPPLKPKSNLKLLASNNACKLPVKPSTSTANPQVKERNADSSLQITSLTPEEGGCASTAATNSSNFAGRTKKIESDDKVKPLTGVKERSPYRKKKEHTVTEDQGRGLKRKKSSDGAQKRDKESMSDNESGGKKPREEEKEECSEGGTKFLPFNLRPNPAPPKNVPAHVFEKLNETALTFRGFFDCSVCKCFYNVDYLLVKEHTIKCKQAKAEEETTRMEYEKKAKLVKEKKAKLQKEKKAKLEKEKKAKSEKEKRALQAKRNDENKVNGRR